MDLNTPVSNLSRVGATTARKLSRLGVKTAAELLNWLPFRYEDYRSIVPIGSLKDGAAVTVRGKIELIANKRSFRHRKIITEALVSDPSGSVRIVWFNQPFIVKNLKPGDVVFLSGKVKADMLGTQFSSPAYERETTGETAHTARLVPIYPLTTGLTQKQIRFLITQILPLTDNITEWLPENILEKFDLAPLGAAMRGIHFPKDEVDLKLSTERLKFNELFLMQLKAELARLKKTSENAPALKFKENEIKQFVAGLPYTLTRAQKVASWEILRDLQKATPMNRLLSGDVGSGKTVVAAMAAYNTVLNGYQAIVMAPTEILARQHYDTMSKLFGEKLRIALLTRSQFLIFNFKFFQPEADRPLAENNIKFLNFKITKHQIFEAISDGSIDIIIGTHALLSEKVEFKDVGLVVVDEQHRFGVSQRKAIKDKTADISAHYLSMTATPIPRSLALMIYGDLDLSQINEMPPGRRPVITRLVEPKNRDKAYEFIRGQVKRGRQVFVVCPLIEEKEDTAGKKSESEIEIINYPFFGGGLSEKKTVMAEFEKLTKRTFPDLRVGFLHGKLKPAEKEAAMAEFKKGAIDIMVATSVIEVGIDIPNASVMMIEGAERFGLAQLHQFRGRVGRSSHQSYCFLFTQSDALKALDRLGFFEKHSDGFKLAEKDLETRGPGEVYGTTQSGLAHLRLAKLTDKEIIKKTRLAAQMIAPEIEKYPVLARKIADWEAVAHLE
jgi:ATP-dependent DNA helicase RecG